MIEKIQAAYIEAKTNESQACMIEAKQNGKMACAVQPYVKGGC
jgi:hypothetical protein